MLALRRFPVGAIDLRREFGHLFDNLLGREGVNLLEDVRPFPAMNVWEDGERLVAEADVPGLGMQDLEITVHGNELMIKGQVRAPQHENAAYYRRERGVGEFTRCLTLPVDVDAEKVEARLRDGVLTITLPKAANARARKITVKSA